MADDLCICHHLKMQHNYSRDGCALPECNCRGFINAETLADLRAQVARQEEKLEAVERELTQRARDLRKSGIDSLALTLEGIVDGLKGGE